MGLDDRAQRRYVEQLQPHFSDPLRAVGFLQAAGTAGEQAIVRGGGIGGRADHVWMAVTVDEAQLLDGTRGKVGGVIKAWPLTAARYTLEPRATTCRVTVEFHDDTPRLLLEARTRGAGNGPLLAALTEV